MIHKLLKTSKFIPSEFHATFFDIDFNKLYKKGLRVILTDLDNTLITYEEFVPTDTIMKKLDSIREIGFEVFIISNNHPPRINTFLKGTNYLGIGNAKKPLKKGIKNLRLPFGKSEQNSEYESSLTIRSLANSRLAWLIFIVIVTFWGLNVYSTYTNYQNRIEKELVTSWFSV